MVTLSSLSNDLYLLAGFVILAGYPPQARAAWKAYGQGVSKPAWVTWVFTSAASTQFALLQVHNPLFLFMSVSNLVGCLVVLLATLLGERRRRA